MIEEELTAIELKYKGQNVNITNLATEIRSNWAEIAELRNSVKFWREAYKMTSNGNKLDEPV